jgi:hypothetical protein
VPPSEEADSMLSMRIVLWGNGREIGDDPPPRYGGEETSKPNGARMVTEPNRLTIGEHMGRIVGTIVVIAIILLYLTGGIRR